MGPSRLCMWLIIFNKKTYPRMSAVSGTMPSTTTVLIASVVPHPMFSAITTTRSQWLPRCDAPRGHTSARSAVRRVSAASARSPVDVSEDEVQAGQDRHDVGHVHAAQHPRQDRHVAERGAADLGAERSGRTLG